MPCELRLMICVWYASTPRMIWLVSDLGLEALVLLDARGARGSSRPAGQHLALVVVVDLEQAVGALDDLHRRLDPGRLERDVGDAVDRDAGRDLDPQRRLAGHRQEAARGLADERRELRLERVEEGVRAQGDLGHRAVTLTRAREAGGDYLRWL